MNINENVEVIDNYLNMKASDTLGENMKKANQQQHEEAQQGINDMITCIQTSKKTRKEKMDVLTNGLEYIRQKCSKREWLNEGLKWMKNAQVAHSEQRNFQYSNAVQAKMVSYRSERERKTCDFIPIPY